MKYYSDEQLWMGIQEGNHLMFKELYSRYVVQLLNQAYKILVDEELSRDLVQDIFLVLYQKRNELSASLNVGAYLLTSVRNRSLNKLRDIKIRKQHLLNITRDGNEEGSMQFAGQVETRIQLNDSIENLPAKWRTAFFLRHVSNQTHEQIGSKMGISIKTVEKYLHSAMTVLKNRMNSEI